MITSLGVAGVLVVYFALTIVALLRAHTPGGVFIVNLVLGWTLVGWCVALAVAARGANRRARA